MESFRAMRRVDRMLGTEETMEIIKTENYGVLSVLGDSGYPYGLPIHYVLIDGKVYFHSTSEQGHKSDSLKNCTKVSFVVIKMESAVKGKSALIFGNVKSVPAMKEAILGAFVEKFAPEFVWEQAKADIPFATDAVDTYVLDIDHMTGKWVDEPA